MSTTHCTMKVRESFKRVKTLKITVPTTRRTTSKVYFSRVKADILTKSNGAVFQLSCQALIHPTQSQLLGLCSHFNLGMYVSYLHWWLSHRLVDSVKNYSCPTHWDVAWVEICWLSIGWVYWCPFFINRWLGDSTPNWCAVSLARQDESWTSYVERILSLCCVSINKSHSIAWNSRREFFSTQMTLTKYCTLVIPDIPPWNKENKVYEH